MSATTTIGACDPATGTVSVTFDQGGASYTREVNAVLTSGVYDPAGTADRVAEVARGMAVKIAVGAVSSDEEVAAIDAPTEIVPEIAPEDGAQG